jgi:hypothetical protein
MGLSPQATCSGNALYYSNGIRLVSTQGVIIHVGSVVSKPEGCVGGTVLDHSERGVAAVLGPVRMVRRALSSTSGR